MNREYLDRELEKLGLLDFERQMTLLAEKTFSGQRAHLTREEGKLLRELTIHQTYGTVENLWRKQVWRKYSRDLSAGEKWDYFRRRLFPSKAYMEKWCEVYAPFFLQHRLLIPAARILRFVLVLRGKRKYVRKEFDIVRKM